LLRTFVILVLAAHGVGHSIGLLVLQWPAAEAIGA
jgi:hypothetical protein